MNTWFRRIIGALRGDAPRPGRLLQPRREDSIRDYPADGLTPRRLAQLLRAADQGDLAGPMQLFEQMEEKDAHLFSVASTRRLALTGLDWQVVSAAEMSDRFDRAQADEAAAYCREVLAAAEGFDEILQHLALAIGRNLAVAEIVWDLAEGGHRIVEFVPVDFTRLVFDDFDRLRILTADAPREGIEPPPFKFIVHTPHAVSGHPSRGGLLRTTALAFLGKQFAVKDWLVFAEVYGMPVRIARYDPAASPEEKRELLEMLRALGSDAAAVFSKAVELEIVQANRGAPNPPYENLANFFNREMSKAWLGQTLTVDTAGSTGTFAAAQVHERVRQDILEDDIRKEGRTIRRDVLRPLTVLRFGADAPVPLFRRRLGPPASLHDLAELLAVAVNDLGLRVPAQWAAERLGIPSATGTQEVLPGRG